MRWAMGIAVCSTLCGAVARGDACGAAAQLDDFVVFVCDATNDEILRLSDADRSTCVEPSEARSVYSDAAEGPDLSIPCHLAEEDGRLLLLDGGTIDGILILDDRDGDGAFSGADETSFFFQNGEGPTLRTPKAFARDGDGLLVADDSKKTPHILRLCDRDGDGIASTEDEVTVFYDPELAVAEPPLLAVRAIARGSEGEIYAADTPAGGVFVLADLNEDGDVNDEDEVQPFLVSGAEVTLGEIGGLLAADGGLYIADGATPAIWFARDADGDGDALDPEETIIFASGPPLVRPMDLAFAESRMLLAADAGARTILVIADLDGDGRAASEDEVVSWLSPEIHLPEPAGIALAPRPRGAVFIRGDIEGDGRVQLNDPIQVLGVLFASDPSPACQDRLDANDDGTIDLADPIFLLAFLFSDGPAPAPPYPDAGEDPTDDALPCPAPERE
ncbi:MAG: hypothetical protein JXP34_09050 [Planctomycetes bacterium]|nr:hypothetical protein [Planctomycetota bacterium]